MTDTPNLDPQHLESRNRLLADYAEFSKLPLEEVLALGEQRIQLSSNEWNSLEGSFEEKAAQFYPSARYYIIDLLTLSKNWNSELFAERSAPFLEHLRYGQTFLDFGGGIGSACIWACENGKKAYYYDICEQHIEFARFRFEKYGYDVEILPTFDWRHHELFDVLYSDAVIEHMLRPENSVNQMCELVRRDGRMVLLIDVQGTADGKYPMHLDVDVDRLYRRTILGGFKTLFTNREHNYVVLEKNLSTEEVVARSNERAARAAELETQAAALEAKIGELDTLGETLRRELADQDVQTSGLELELRQQERVGAELRQQIEALNKQMAEAGAAKGRLEQELRQVREQLNKALLDQEPLQRRLIEAAKEVAEACGRLATAEGKRAEAESRRADAERERTSAECHAARDEVRVEFLEKAAQQEQALNEGLRRRQAQLEEQLEALRAQLAEAQGAKARLEEKSRALEESGRILHQKLADSEQETRRMQAELARQRERYEQLLEESTGQREQYEQLLEESTGQREQYEQLLEESARLHEQKETLERELEDKVVMTAEEREGLERNLSQTSERLATVQEMNRRLRLELSELDTQRLLLLKRVEQAEAQKSHTDRLAEDLRQEITQMDQLFSEQFHKSKTLTTTLYQEISEKNQLLWNQKRQLMQLEMDLARISNRPAYRLIDRLSKNQMLTRIWIRFYHSVRALLGRKAEPQPAPSSLPPAAQPPAPAAKAAPAREESLPSRLKNQLAGALQSSSSGGSPEIMRRFELRRLKDVLPPRKTNLALYTCGECEALRRALISLRHHTNLEANPLFLIDDSQDSEVAGKIAEWTQGMSGVQFIRPVLHRGYYAAVRELIDEHPKEDFCVMRETVVLTPEWLEQLRAAAYSSQNIALVSPFTTFHPLYEFKMNPGDNVMSCARKLRLAASPEYPGIALPDVNIFYLKQTASALVPFPNDVDDSTDKPFVHLVLELFKKNLIPILADDTFVYVSNRFGRLKAGALAEILGRLDHANRELLNQMIAYTRQLELASLNNYKASEIRLIDERTVGILYSTIVLGGGVLILAELNNDLVLNGVDAKGIVLHPDWINTPERFDLLFEPVWTGDADKIMEHLPNHSLLLATMWTTAQITDRLAKLNPTLKPYYFMQDFEVLFYDPDNPKEQDFHAGACASYKMDLKQLTTSDWIVNQVRGFLGNLSHPIQKIGIGINQEVYYPDVRVRRAEAPIRVIAMARPSTPRRGFQDLVNAMAQVHQQDASVEFALFGTKDLSQFVIPFPYENLGILNPEQLRSEYSKAHIFIDSSLFQGFGLPGLEAMACGCACVLTDSGGASEYAIEGTNALMVPPGDIAAMAQAILRLAGDGVLRGKLMHGGRRAAANFSNHNTARDLGRILERLVAERAAEIKSLCTAEVCNIVIPIYNEISFVRLCLESVAQHTDVPYRVYLVDDCSDSYNAQYLKKFAETHPHFVYLRNEQNLGFVGSANKGMAAAERGDIVLLNSDTIVTPGWLSKLVRCARSEERIGIVSPLTTRSSHLWIQLNPGDSIFDTAAAIEELSERAYPDIMTPEGWCFYIKRELYERLGGLDPIFGRGYCEESDFSMRAFVNGYRLVCCDDTFIFHEGMVTFKGDRGPRYEANRKIFDRRWKSLYEKNYRQFLVQDPLGDLRRRYAQRTPAGFMVAADARKVNNDNAIHILNEEDLTQAVELYKNHLPRRLAGAKAPAAVPHVVFLLHGMDNYGGIISILQLVNDMILAGIRTQVVVMKPKEYSEDLCILTRPILFSSNAELVEHFPQADLVVGTLWITMYFVVKILQRGSPAIPAYFVQDFEPYFYPETEQKMRQAVSATYPLTPHCFAKTPWICQMVRTAGGRIDLVPPALDLDLFYPRDVAPLGEKKVILTIMRPSTPQRGFDTVCKVFAELFAERDDFELHAFGASDEELAQYQLPFAFTNHGVLPNAHLPKLYSQAWLFAEFSNFHGFGRTIAEAMACGTACVISDSGGVSLFAKDGENCLIAPPGDVAALKANVARLLDDPALRQRLVGRGRPSLGEFDRTHSSRKTIELLQGCLGIAPNGNGNGKASGNGNGSAGGKGQGQAPVLQPKAPARPGGMVEERVSFKKKGAVAQKMPVGPKNEGAGKKNRKIK